MANHTKSNEAQARASYKYQQNKVDNISVYVPKGQREVIRERAASLNMSMNQYIVRAINKALSEDDAM